MRFLHHGLALSLATKLLTAQPKQSASTQLSTAANEAPPLDNEQREDRPQQLMASRPTPDSFREYAPERTYDRGVIPPNVYRRQSDRFARNPTPYR